MRNKIIFENNNVHPFCVDCDQHTITSQDDTYQDAFGIAGFIKKINYCTDILDECPNLITECPKVKKELLNHQKCIGCAELVIDLHEGKCEIIECEDSECLKK